MLKKYVDLLRQEFDAQKSFEHVQEICKHHRIQASPGHRAAADYSASQFIKAGLATEILSYAGDGTTAYWNYLMPEEWVATKGVLELLGDEPEILADFSEIPISLIQRSISADRVEAELVFLGKSDEEEDYPDLDLNGKIVFTSGDYDYVRGWAVESRGAIGIVTDRMAEFPPVRLRSSIPDARTYTSFWWYGGEKKCFGFVVSPRMGDDLRAKAEKQTLRVRATVKSKFYPGHVEIVSALIKGKTEEEVVLTAHLCHPQPSANDNASGCGAAIETARTLQFLINRGELEQPERSIRFLLLPEMSGSYAFLANNEELIPNMVAAINLDMVGENQCLTGGPLVAVTLPNACNHFAGDLVEAALEQVAKEVPNLNGSSKYALFMHTMSPFTGGSDHYIFADPTVGVGTPMLIQWPDKFYHTSEDTLDKVDPEMLKRVGLLAGSYLYFAANGGQSEATWLAGRIQTGFARDIGEYLNLQTAILYKYLDHDNQEDAAILAKTLPAHIDYLGKVKLADLYSLTRLSDSESVKKWLAFKADEMKTAMDQAKHSWLLFCAHNLGDAKMTPAKEDKNMVKAATLIPKRPSRGPLSLRGRIRKMDPADQKAYRYYSQNFKRDMGKMTYLLYWMDGKRNLAEVIEQVRQETGSMNAEVAIYLTELLIKLGLLAY